MNNTKAQSQTAPVPTAVWTITLLVAGYIALQLIADVTAAKIVQIGPITLPAGTFVFALTFTWRDLLHKRLGKTWAQAAIVVAALCNLLMVGYFAFAIALPPAPFWPGQEAFAGALGVVWRITLASIVAEVVSELVDTEAYHALTERGAMQWARVAGSNAVSLPLDSLIFGVVAFAGIMPAAGIAELIVGQVIFKAAVTVLSLPGIYLIPARREPAATVAG